MSFSHKNIFACTAGAAAMLVAMPAMAQSSSEDVVIATGIRSSLKQSLDVKRSSNQVVDAISAEDVGKFPDSNIAESLQRITGVAIDRSGGEGQFITVRGLGPEFNTVTLNGRTLATDNPGREFSFDVISSDIISRAEVFKTSTPDLQSGGIGANVNIVTTRPLSGGTSLTGSLSGTYDTLREKFSPEGSLVGSWSNDARTVGFAGGISYSDRATQRDRVLTNGFSDRSNNPFIDTDGAGTANATGLTDGTISGLNENNDGDSVFLLPAGTRVQQQAIVSRDVQDRERITLNGTAQFRPAENIELTIDGLYSEFNIESFDTQFSGFFSPPFIDPVVDSNGTVTSFSRPGVDFLARNPGLTTGESQNDNVLTSNNREADTYLVGANLDWEVSDAITANFDVSTSKATRDGINPFVVLGALAPSSPLISLPDDSEITTLENIVGAQDASIQRLHFVNVNRTVINDEIFELKGGFDWAANNDMNTVISLGASYSDRQKSGDLFDNFSPTQGGGIFCAYCGYGTDFDDSILSEVNLNGFLSGVDGADRIPVNFLTASFEDAFAQLNSDAAISDPNRSGRAALSDAELRARRDATDSFLGFYDPEFNAAGSFAVDEAVTSVFFNSAWESNLGSIPYSANFGFRVARTETDSSGVDQPVVQFRESAGDTQLVPVLGASTPVTISNAYTNFLPSANIKLDVTEDKIVRLAVSKTVTRPTLTALGVANSFAGRANAPTSTGGNPRLEAFESTNFDAAFEWYVDDLSFFGVSGFYKDFGNFIESSTIGIPTAVVFPAGNASNPGPTDVTRTVNRLDTRNRNGETGSLIGLEVAAQTAFENGFGVQANYTYVDSSIDRAEGSAFADLDYNGLSPHSFNVSGFYEKGPIQARLSYNYRDEFLVLASDGSAQGEPREREAYGQLDFSAAYEVTDMFQVFAEGVNLLDEDRRDFSRFKNRFLEYEDTGSRFTLGLRGTF